MGMLSLLLCSLLPLAVLGVAVIHGLRTGDAGTAAALVITAVILTASALLPFAGEPEPVPSRRFTRPETGAVAANRPNDNLLRFTHRWGQDEVSQ
jgi:hypothetical protein